MKGKSWWFVLLVFIAAWATTWEVRGGPPSCALCAGATKIACPTCAGKGRCLVPCDVCDGKGKVACRMKGDYAGPKLQPLIAAVYGHVGLERPCPNEFCIEGKIKWESSGKTATCKLCGGAGKVPCIDCKASQTPCAACGGRGKIEGRCVDCAGTGSLRCLLCATQTTCPQCGGADRPCPECDGKKTALSACETCGGRGTEPCDKCEGVGRVACAECGATGKSRMVYADGTSASASRCTACEGKGATPCAACKSTGRMKCSVCDGAKRVMQTCRACRGDGRADCTACSNFGFRALELEASVLAKPDAARDANPGARDAAITLYARAFERADEYRRAAADALNKATDKVGKLPEPPAAGATKAESRAYRDAARKKVDDSSKAIGAMIWATWEAARAQDAATRCEKALAALRAPAPK